MQEEATINPDGTTYMNQEDNPNDETFEGGPEDETFFEETIKEVTKKGIDPALYLVLGVVIAIAAYYFFVVRKKKDEDEDDFFSNLDGDKVRQRRTGPFFSFRLSFLTMWTSLVQPETPCRSG